MKMNKITAATLLVSILFFPMFAFATTSPQESVIELSARDANSSGYRHTGDIAFSNQKGSAENVLASVKKEVQRRGENYYRITRLQLMENSSWSVNAATYAPSPASFAPKNSIQSEG
jgi:hypothetical protein